eukprot:scaffold1336_cov379-Prasinococcus_capsulatus_cf.AAC.11
MVRPTCALRQHLLAPPQVSGWRALQPCMAADGGDGRWRNAGLLESVIVPPPAPPGGDAPLSEEVVHGGWLQGLTESAGTYGGTSTPLPRMRASAARLCLGTRKL